MQKVQIGDKLEVEPCIARFCGRQTKRANTPAASPAKYYIRTLIPFLDHLNQQMTERFSELNRNTTLQLLPPVKDTTYAETLSFFVDNLPSPAAFNQEVEIWRRKWTDHPSLPKTLEEVMQLCVDGLYPNVKTTLKSTFTLHVTSFECDKSICSPCLVKRKLRPTKGLEGVAICILK